MKGEKEKKKIKNTCLHQEQKKCSFCEKHLIQHLKYPIPAQELKQLSPAKSALNIPETELLLKQSSTLIYLT